MSNCLWSVKIADVLQQAQDGKSESFDLSVKNPNKKEEAALRSPKEILHEMKKLDEEAEKIMKTIGKLV
jgi:type I restriction enzyme M protein